MNRRASYSAFIGLMALGLLFFILSSSRPLPSESTSEALKERFRQIPLIVENTAFLYDEAAEKAIISFYSTNPLCSFAMPSNDFLVELSNVSTAIGTKYNLSCFMAINGFMGGSGDDYEVSFIATISCSSVGGQVFSFDKIFRLKKEITALDDGFGNCSLLTITDAYSEKQVYP